MRLRCRGDRVALFLFCLVTGSVRAADAQQDRVYAGVSGVLSTQGSVKPGASPSFPTTGVGGTAVGVAGELGTSFNRTLSLAFEASVPARFESIQETDYFSVFRTENRHRDVIFSGLFHVHVTPTGPVRVGLVAGPSVIREDTLQSTAFQLGPLGATTGNFGPFGAERPLTRWTVGLTVGADVGVEVTRHMQVVPQLRLHVVQRATVGDDTTASAFLGLSSLIVRPAVGVRVGF